MLTKILIKECEIQENKLLKGSDFTYINSQISDNKYPWQISIVSKNDNVRIQEEFVLVKLRMV